MLCQLSRRRQLLPTNPIAFKRAGRTLSEVTSHRITVRSFMTGGSFASSIRSCPSRLRSSRALWASQEVGSDCAAPLHPFKLLIQLPNATCRVRNELLPSWRTRIACVGRTGREWVGANTGLSEHVDEGVQRLIERCQVRCGALSTTAWMPRAKPN